MTNDIEHYFKLYVKFLKHRIAASKRAIKALDAASLDTRNKDAWIELGKAQIEEDLYMTVSRIIRDHMAELFGQKFFRYEMENGTKALLEQNNDI